MQSGKGKNKKQGNHHADYFARLKKQFEACSYGHAGAYRHSTSARSVEMQGLAKSIDRTEETLHGEKYQTLQKTGYFKQRTSDRLRRAGSFFKGKIP